jgi:anti-anti-sigma factor
MSNDEKMEELESRHGTAHVSISGSPRQVVRINGDVDLANTHDIYHRISSAYRPDVDQVVVDLGGITYLDSAGLGMLVRIASSLAAARTTMTVVAPPESVAGRVISLSGLADELLLHADEPPS